MAKFEFVPNRYYTIAAKATGHVLEVADFDLENGGVIQLWDDVGTESQQWKIVAVEDRKSVV